MRSHTANRASLAILAISRAYSLPYVALFGVCGMLTGAGPIILVPALIACLLPVALGVGVAALNDWAHVRADVRAERNRAYSPMLLAGLGGGGTLLAIGLAIWGGIGVFAGVLGSILAGVIYGELKSRPGIANTARGLTSFALALGLAALNQAVETALLLAVGVALLDAAGNIWGDVRDQKADRRAGVQTLVVVNPKAARWLAFGLHGIATVFLSSAIPLVWPLLAGSWLAAHSHTQTAHLVFLLAKYATFGVIGTTLASTGPELALVVGLTLMALPAALIYRAIHLRSA